MKYEEQINYYSKLTIHEMYQLTFTCLKSAIQTLEKGVNYVKS